MIKHIELYKNYSLNQSGYRLKLPLNLETFIPEENVVCLKNIWAKKKGNLVRIASDEGILLRINRSIQDFIIIKYNITLYNSDSSKIPSIYAQFHHNALP